MTRNFHNSCKKIGSAVICNQLSLMFLADAFQYDLMIKRIHTATRIFDCLIFNPFSMTIYLISLRQLCHIVFYSIISIILYQLFQADYIIKIHFNPSSVKMAFSLCKLQSTGLDLVLLKVRIGCHWYKGSE